MKNFAAGRSGSALIVTLWVIGLLALFVTTFAFEMHIEARVISAWRKALKAEELARGGLELARKMLTESGDQTLAAAGAEDLPPLLDEAAQAARQAAISLARGGGATTELLLGPGSLLVSVHPENANINLNGLIHVDDRAYTYELWQPLFETAEVPWEMRDSLVDCVLDWVDDNDFSRLNGAESDYYQGLTPPYSAKNGPFDTVEELLLVKGFDAIIPDREQTVYDALAGHLTVYSEGQKVNINAVSRETLMAFLNIDEMMADEIIAQRTGPDDLDGTDDDQPFRDMNDLMARIPYLTEEAANHIAFSAGGLYAVESRGRVDDVERVIYCTISFNDGELTLLSWEE